MSKHALVVIAPGSEEMEAVACIDILVRGSITVTVIDVLPNGNLVVGGEKQVNVNGEISDLRLTGVVNPRDIKAGNTISSKKVADARIEYKESGVISEAQVMGWLARFFLTFIPF